jgi:hypothetical protein
MCYTRIPFGACPNHMHIQITVKKQLVGEKKEKKNTTAQIRD